MTTTLIPIISAIAAAIVVLVLTPVSMWLAGRLGAVDMPSERRIHTRPIPRLGGIAIVLGFMLPAAWFLPADPAVRGLIAGAVLGSRAIVDEVRGRDVLLVDDILESGFTLSFAKTLLKERGARKVWVCTLLDKPEKRRTDLKADFVGFEAGDEFLVGYGLDWAHRFRGLPYIGVVEKTS